MNHRGPHFETFVVYFREGDGQPSRKQLLLKAVNSGQAIVRAEEEAKRKGWAIGVPWGARLFDTDEVVYLDRGDIPFDEKDAVFIKRVFDVRRRVEKQTSVNMSHLHPSHQ